MALNIKIMKYYGRNWIDIELNAGLANSGEFVVHRSCFYLIKDAFLRKLCKTVKEWKELGNANMWKSNVYVSIA